MINAPEFPAMIDQATLATVLRVPVTTVKGWRYTKPPRIPFVRCGRRVMYKADDVLAYIEQQRRQ